MAPIACQSSVTYLARAEKYKHEKPFTVDFSHSTILGAVQHNRVFDPREVQLRPIDRLSPTSLDTVGCCYVKAEQPLPIDEHAGRDTIEKDFFDEVRQLFRRHFPQYDKMAFIDYKIRKRNAAFPDDVGRVVEHAQPATLAHCDYSIAAAQQRVSYFTQADPTLADREVDLLNVWRVLKGPNNDWPLAFCDFRTVDTETDAIDHDVVGPEDELENTMLHYNPRHEWFYMNDMVPNDYMVFRQGGSDPSKPRVWHAAVQIPTEYVTQDFLRGSIETRIVAFIRPNDDRST